MVNANDGSTEEFNPPAANVAAGASDNTYKITGLTYAATYEITIAVRYADSPSVDSTPVRNRTGMDPDDLVEPITPITDDRAVAAIQTAVSGNNITVRWTNPAQENINGFINGFNVTWFNVDNESDGDTAELNATLADVAPGARVSYNITGLLYNTTYAITIAVLYANGTSVVSVPAQSTTGMDPDGDGAPRDAFPPVSDLEIIPAESSLRLSWRNPNRDRYPRLQYQLGECECDRIKLGTYRG